MHLRVCVRSRQLPSVSLVNIAQRPARIVGQRIHSLCATGSAAGLNSFSEYTQLVRYRLNSVICILTCKSVSIKKHRDFIQPFISIVKSLLPIKLKSYKEALKQQMIY